MKKALVLFITLTIGVVFAKQLSIVFSGSNNGYYRDCG